MRLILDTDPGNGVPGADVDDALAIGLALRSPEIELEAITVVAGNVPAERGVRCAMEVLEAAGATHVPVHLGAACLRPTWGTLPVRGSPGWRNASGTTAAPCTTRSPSRNCWIRRSSAPGPRTSNVELRGRLTRGRMVAWNDGMVRGDLDLPGVRPVMIADRVDNDLFMPLLLERLTS